MPASVIALVLGCYMHAVSCQSALMKGWLTFVHGQSDYGIAGYDYGILLQYAILQKV
jgi:hypothetical protein